MIVNGKTSSGFEYSVDTRRVEDFRYVRILAKLSDQTLPDTEKVMYSIEAIETLLGKEDVDKLCEYIAAANDGYAPSEAVIREALEINGHVAAENNRVKNSQPSLT